MSRLEDIRRRREQAIAGSMVMAVEVVIKDVPPLLAVAEAAEQVAFILLTFDNLLDVSTSKALSHWLPELKAAINALESQP